MVRYPGYPYRVLVEFDHPDIVFDRLDYAEEISGDDFQIVNQTYCFKDEYQALLFSLKYS